MAAYSFEASRKRTLQVLPHEVVRMNRDGSVTRNRLLQAAFFETREKALAYVAKQRAEAPGKKLRFLLTQEGREI